MSNFAISITVLSLAYFIIIILEPLIRKSLTNTILLYSIWSVIIFNIEQINASLPIIETIKIALDNALLLAIPTYYYYLVIDHLFKNSSNPWENSDQDDSYWEFLIGIVKYTLPFPIGIYLYLSTNIDFSIYRSLNYVFNFPPQDSLEIYILRTYLLIILLTPTVVDIAVSVFGPIAAGIYGLSKHN